MREPADIAAYQSVPIAYELIDRAPESMVLGLHGEHIDFDWRPYNARSPDARADYDRLRADIASRGIRAPVIAWRDHVLVGMRRVEIARSIGIASVRCAAIVDEDARQWWRYDIARLERLKVALGVAAY